MHYENETMRAWDLFNVFTRKARQLAQIQYYPEWHNKVYLCEFKWALCGTQKPLC